MEKLFDWNRILFNELPPAFLLEVVMRSVIMFVIILGQVKTVLIETSGDISTLFFPDDDVKPGLPVYPLPQQNRSPRYA